jgi:hypothetical protein
MAKPPRRHGRAWTPAEVRSVSRVNGGTSHVNDLRLSCPGCNLSKPPLDARQLVR